MDEDFNWLEWAVDGGAASLLAAAGGYCAALLSTPLWAMLVALVSFGACLSLLRLAGGQRRYSLPTFALAGWADVLTPEPLLLDTPTVDSRVVPLRPVASSPTPGEFSRRIDDHLARKTESSTTPDEDVVLLGADASAALRHAFNELKRSLR